MIKVYFAICLIILFAVLYNVAPHMGMPNKYIIAAIIIAPFAISYTSYMVLKYGQPSDHKFEEE